MSGQRPGFRDARWYTVRPAGSTKPATYRCPLCGRHLPALSAHLLVLPDGDASRRRHAHTDCVVRARKAGKLPLREEVEPRRPGLLARLLRRG
jgi:hypothetical protein